MAQAFEPPMKGFAAVFTAPRYFGRTLELPECAAALARMSFESVAGRIALLKHVNDGIYADPDTPAGQLTSYTERAIDFLFDEGRRDLARQEAASDEKFRPVADQALLATLELARLCCPRDGQHWIDADPLRLDLTHVILSFQDVLLSRDLQKRLEADPCFEVLGEAGCQELIRNRIAHNTSRYYRHALGRLFALCRNPEIEVLVRERTSNKSIHDWFVAGFGLTPDEYLVCSSLVVAPAWALDLRTPDATTCFYRPATYWQLIDESVRAKVHALMSLATRPVDEPTQTPDIRLDDFLYDCCLAHVHPVLDLGPVALCISPHLLMNKFVIGLPYLAQEIAAQRAAPRRLNDGEVTAARSPFGIMFECYVIWLVRKYLSGWTGTEIVSPMWCGSTKEHGECDLVIIRRDIAFVFEVKTTLATLAFRRTGSFTGLDAIVLEGAEQAYRAAMALRAGVAVCASDKKPIDGIRFVVPCVVTYEDIPLYDITASIYERHLAQVTGSPLFSGENGIEPLQFLDVDFIESWESKFDLSPNSGAPFGYLMARARDLVLRYKGIQDGIAAPARPEAPRPFDELINESRNFIEMQIRANLQRPAVGAG